MGSVYTAPTVTGYNSNPPSDDGSTASTNRLLWANHKTKIGDPLKTALEQDFTNVAAAFGKVQGGITATAISYQVLSGDQGKTIKVTASATITTPDATSVGSPFKFKVVNLSSGDITIDGSGSQTIDGSATITVAAGAGVDLDTDGSNWFTAGQNFVRTQIVPQGYLSLVTGTPVITSDQTAKTSVFYCLDKGNLVPIPNGTKFVVFEIAELTLSLASQHTASNIYDVFLFENPSAAGTIVIGTGPAWTTATAGSGARGTGAGTTELTRLKGVLVNNVAATMRNGATTYSVGASSGIYVGTLFIDGTNGQISCHVSWGASRKWGVWNAYNRKRIILQAGDSTASWTYNSATVRESNGASTNTIAALCGLREDVTVLEFTQKQNVSITDTNAQSLIGIGVNSTTVMSGLAAASRLHASSIGFDADFTPTAHHNVLLPLGVNNINSLEAEPTAGLGTITYYGTNANMILSVEWMG